MSAKATPFASFLTLSAVACAAYLVADVAHEGLGHGGACLALGGQVLSLSTTFEDCSIRSRLIDGAGPVEGIITALVALAWLRLAPPRAANMRVFLCLVFAFAIFWNVGYLIKSGVTGTGDWHFVIAGLEPGGVWHAAIAVAGIVLYVGAMRVLGATMIKTLKSETGMPPLSFALCAYLAAAALSAAGASFDPRGAATILSDALPSSLGAIGLVLTAYRLPALRIVVPPSPAWIATGFAGAAFFIALLGPGL